MAGIYFHIPFCKQACHYCDFHFVTSLKYKEDMLRAMHKELRLQQAAGFFPTGQTLNSVYFGGGTPSILETHEIASLLALCHDLFDLSSISEVTLEANPDDLSPQKIAGLKQAGVNRLSIGVQSFFDEDLQWMNRAHVAAEAEAAIRAAQDGGIENITADLIYGYPLLTDKKWEQNIQTMVDLGIPHISAYSMTVEPRTALGTLVKRGKEKDMSDEQSATQFERLMERLEDAGYLHYEVSNWAKPGREAVHNGNYWKGEPYLGIGPSAHSFDGTCRQWNVANNAKYMQGLAGEVLPEVEREELTPANRLNEYIMTSLRTSWGLDLNKVRAEFDEEMWKPLAQALTQLEMGGLVKAREDQEGVFVLTKSGLMLADRIASDLFI